jgi:beta-lactam-binding protein with PASTA domain
VQWSSTRSRRTLGLVGCADLASTQQRATLSVSATQTPPTLGHSARRYRLGKIGRAYSKVVRRGRVISQRPKFGAVLPNGGKVNLVVSRGRKP